jgi:hypothetical protein
VREPLDSVDLARNMEQEYHGKRIAGAATSQSNCINLDPMEFSCTILGGRVGSVRKRGKLDAMDPDNGWRSSVVQR